MVFYIEYCLALYGIAWHCMVLHGIVWYCLALYCIAWYCMVLHGIAISKMLTPRAVRHVRWSRLGSVCPRGADLSDLIK